MNAFYTSERANPDDACRQDFIEIMDMLDRRLNDKGKNWRHVFKVCKHDLSTRVRLYQHRETRRYWYWIIVYTLDPRMWCFMPRKTSTL